jgi:hypothetical protein
MPDVSNPDTPPVIDDSVPADFDDGPWFQAQPPKVPGLLGSLNDIRLAIGAAGAAQSRTLPSIYPKTLDPTVERHVAEYNQTYGLRPGDREYLDPDLVKAMIRQEAGRDYDALLRDPMQVNAFAGDWDPRKADYGLTKGSAPGADLSVRAGIQWLRRKAYVHDDRGNEVGFRGWPQAVQRYNAHLPDYSDQVMDHLGEIKGGL